MLRLNFLFLDFCSYCSFAGPFGNIGINSWALESALTLALALQNFYFCKSFNFCLSMFIMK